MIGVFISYSRADSILCEAVAQELEELDSVRVVRDTSGSDPGSPLRARIQAQIRDADVFVVLVTRRSASSSWIMTEIAWASEMGKKIIPLVEDQVDISSIPGLDPGTELVALEMSRYEIALQELSEAIFKLASDGHQPGSIQGNRSDRSQQENRSALQPLSGEEVDNLLSLGAQTLAPSLAKQMVRLARRFLLDLEAKTGALNFDALETDSDAVVIRRDSLHALLRAAAVNQESEFHRAGLEAGVLFGTGLLRWFTERQAPGLPVGIGELLAACLRVDRASHWGNVSLVELSRARDLGGWKGRLLIGSHFLSHEIVGGSTNESEKRYAKYRSFWKSYIEGAFSSALAGWYGLWTSQGHEFPLFCAICSEPIEETVGDLVFDFSLVPPRYRTVVEHLQEKVLCPYIRRERSPAIEARIVLEDLVRQIAAVEGDAFENLHAGLTWLQRSGPPKGRNAASYLQRTRNFLNPYAHEPAQLSAELVRRIVRSTSGAVIQACRDIELSTTEREGMADALSESTRRKASS